MDLDEERRMIAADEREEMLTRIVAAEEQAAAAWSMCAALQKALEELRQDVATELVKVEESQKLFIEAAEGMQSLDRRITGINGDHA